MMSENPTAPHSSENPRCASRGGDFVVKADGYSTDEHRHINRASQQSPEEDIEHGRMINLIVLAVVLAVMAIICKWCWG